MWRIARFVGRIMSHVPGVRGVFISGQLCRYIAEKGSDIDYFIVTDPGRLWIVRTLFVLLRRTLLFNRRTFLCTNYLVTTTNLAIRERNQYVACEIASLKPLVNRPLFDRFLRENRWIEDYYPNHAPGRMDLRPGIEGRSSLQVLLESLVPSRLADRLDCWLMGRTAAFWRRKYPDFSEESHEKSLRTRRDESRAHADDQSPVILRAWRETLRRYGIAHD